MKTAYQFAWSLLFCFLVNGLFAQIVNIEKKRSNPLDSVYWIGDVLLGASLVQNTKQIVNLNGSIRLDYIRYDHSFLSLSNYTLGKVDDQDFINQGFQHFRYNYKINERLTWEAFTQVQYNEQILLQLRWLLGTGPRIGVYLKEEQQFYLGVLYMYEYDEEKLENDEVIFYRDHRLSTYFNIQLQPLEFIAINSTTYFQPVLHRLEDYRLSTETSMEMQITSRLTFNTTLTLLYDSVPPEGIPKTIYTFKNGLSLKF